MEFIIYSPGFNDKIGGLYALHLLCHLLNKNGAKASMYPWFYHDEISAIHIKAPLSKAIASRDLLNNYPAYITNPRWNTPVYSGQVEEVSGRTDLIVVYPEVVFGNPLRAKNIARWLLNTPGAHNKKIYFTYGEVQFLYREFFQPLKQMGLETADFLLHVLEVPWDLFGVRNPNVSTEPRGGTAYALRKGKHKPIQHELEGSILIDNLSMQEVGEVFKKVETFISYDTASLYSHLAVLSGCNSIVIPDVGVTKEQWRVNVEDTYGVAYGFKEMEFACSTRHLVPGILKEWEGKSLESVQRFVDFWSCKALISGSAL